MQKAEKDLDLGSGYVKDVEDRVILLELVKMLLTQLLVKMSIGVQKMLLTQFLVKMSIGVQKMLERQMLNPLMLHLSLH